MSIDRLNALKAENDSAGLEMMTEAGRFAALANRNNNGLAPRAITAFNLFQTPEAVAHRMVSMIPETMRHTYILEPSAGLGRLYNAIRERFSMSEYTLIENNPDCMKELYSLTEVHRLTRLIQKDFLTFEAKRAYNVIIMNPPFKMGRDVKHIKHAAEMLTPGGILVSLCYNGVKQNRDLKPLCDTWEVLPEGSFKSEGTRAEVVLLTIKEPVNA